MTSVFAFAKEHGEQAAAAGMQAPKPEHSLPDATVENEQSGLLGLEDIPEPPEVIEARQRQVKWFKGRRCELNGLLAFIA